ncbi:MAG: hypothetical protein ACLQVM_30130 [Terriglobia bacterium]
MNPTRRSLLVSTVVAPLGAFAAEVTGGCSEGCARATDPKATAISVADLLCAQPAPGKPIPLQEESHPDPKEPDTWFNLLFGGEYWDKDQVTYQKLDAVRKVRPDVLHASIFGPELLGALPTGGKVAGVTPMSPPGVTTVREYLAWWKKVIDEAHRLGAKVQATFSMSLLHDTISRDRGWFRYYNNFWEADILGPKPVSDPLDLLQRDEAGRPHLSAYVGRSFQARLDEDVYQYQGCPNNPHWRQLLKQLVAAGIKAGFDGFMAQFNYRFACMCQHCQKAFRRHLSTNHSPECLRDRLGIADFDKAILDTTFGATGKRGGALDLAPQGTQECDQPGPLELEARQFTSESVRGALKEVFLEYGRSLKPDLLVSAWTHTRRFLLPGVDYRTEGINPFNERMLLPPEQWGRGEDYIWYSIGPPKSNLQQHNASDSSLSAKYIYAMSKGKPFMTLKYDLVRVRLTLAEAWAHRSIGLALDRREALEVLASYYDFAHRYRDLYYPSESYAELGLLFPNRAMYGDDASFLTPLEHFARALLDNHGLFDVLIDQHLSDTNLSRYRAVLLPATAYLSPAERKQMDAYRRAGGLIVVAGRTAGQEQQVASLAPRTALAPNTADLPALAAFIREAVARETGGPPLSGCDAPWTVQVTVWHQPHHHRVLVHLVNYDRDEAVVDQENPRAAGPVKVRLNLPPGARLAGARFVTPEEPDPRTLTTAYENGQVLFRSPAFLVYGVAIVDYSS